MSTNRVKASSLSRSQSYASSVVVSGKAPCGPNMPRNRVLRRTRPARVDARGLDGRIGKLEIRDSVRGPRIRRRAFALRRCAAFRGFSLSSRLRTAKQVETPGFGDEFGAKRHDTPLQPDARRPAHDLAALDCADDRLSEVVDRHVLGEEPVEDRAEEKRPGSFEGLLLEYDGDLEAPGRGGALGLPQTPDDRTRADAAHTADLAVGRAVSEVGEQDERFPQARSRRLRQRSTRPRWLRLSMLTRRQATSPVETSIPLPSSAVM